MKKIYTIIAGVLFGLAGGFVIGYPAQFLIGLFFSFTDVENSYTDHRLAIADRLSSIVWICCVILGGLLGAVIAKKKINANLKKN